MSEDAKTSTVPPSTANRWLMPTALALAAFGIIFTGLSGFGVWDPWELDAAESARSARLWTTHGLRQTILAAAFGLLGTQEWVGRLPNAVSAVLTVAVTFQIGCALRRSDARRSATYAALILLGTPIFLINAQMIFGNSISVLLQCTTAWLSFELLASRTKKHTLLFGALAIAAAIASTLASGFMCGTLPIVIAVSALIWLRADRASRRWSALAAAAIACLVVALEIDADRTSYSWVLGGSVTQGTPPSFDKLIETNFHGFAPWSALLPIAFGMLLRHTFSVIEEETNGGPYRVSDQPASVRAVLSESQAAAVFLGTWLAVGYVATLIFNSRYGTTTFLPVPAVALACGSAISQLRSHPPGWGAALIVALLIGLAIRDFSIYPALPIEALGALDDVRVPDEFNPVMGWAFVLGCFALACFIAFDARSPTDAPLRRFGLDIAPMVQFVRNRWHAGWGFRVWLIAAAALGAGLLIFGLLSWVAADELGLVVIVRKWGRRLMFLPLLVPLAVLGLQVALRFTRWAGKYREQIVVGTGLLTGLFVSFYFVPELSAHLSPREIYDRFDELRKEGEPLGEYRRGSRAAQYYTDVEVNELNSTRSVVNFLKGEKRAWVVTSSESLPEIDSLFREVSNEEHVFVVQSEGATAALITNEPIAGMQNANPMANAVRSEVPKKMDHKTSINFADKVELVGYDIDLPHKDYVGAGESFKITWYWKVLSSNVGNYKIFVHVDGHGLRLNGDHEPVHGTYPVRMWKKGEVIADTQTLDVGANYRPGQYTIYVGFWAGQSRLDVKTGNASSNRARAGYLQVR